jgi:hypothetical protein
VLVLLSFLVGSLLVRMKMKLFQGVSTISVYLFIFQVSGKMTSTAGGAYINSRLSQSRELMFKAIRFIPCEGNSTLFLPLSSSDDKVCML